MTRSFSIIFALALAFAPSVAFASTATLRLILTIPVQCTLDVVNGIVLNNTVVLHVHRNCNTGHQVVLSGLQGDRLGTLTVNYNGNNKILAGDSVSIPQVERYYNQTDSIVIEAENADIYDMRRLAGSIQLSVDVG